MPVMQLNGLAKGMPVGVNGLPIGVNNGVPVGRQLEVIVCPDCGTTRVDPPLPPLKIDIFLIEKQILCFQILLDEVNGVGYSICSDYIILI